MPQVAAKNNKPLTLLAISILALAASLSYFTFELSRFIQQVPGILDNIESTSDKLQPVLTEINQIRNLVPPILDEVRTTREQIPPILTEVKNVREIIPPVLNEVAKSREQISLLVNEVEVVRKQLPAILTSVDSISAEMKAYRPIASEALIQVAGMRKEAPEILDKTEGLIDKARQAGKEASSGAVTGVITGILTAPFRIVGNFGSNVLGLSSDEADDYTEEDFVLLQKHGKDLISAGKLNDSRSWKNMDTNRRFKISLKKIYSKDSRECRDLHLQSWTKSKLVLDKVIAVCLNDDGEWDYQ